MEVKSDENGKVDTNIYNVEGWGSLNTEKTDSSDLNRFTLIGYVENLHVQPDFNTNIRILVTKCINYFFNNPDRIYYISNISVNNRRYTINNIKYHYKVNDLTSDGREEWLFKVMNNMRPFITVVKTFKNNNYKLFKQAWLNKFSQKLNYNFYTTDTYNMLITKEILEWNTKLNNRYIKQGDYTYSFLYSIHGKECKANDFTNYYWDSQLEDSSNYSKKYKDFGRINYLFASSYPCYDYPGAANKNRCVEYSFTTPDGNYPK